MNPSSASLNFGFRPEHVVEMFLRGYSGLGAPTLAEVHASVSALLVGPFASLQPNLEQIVHEVLRRIDVRIGAASVLDNAADHEPWLETANLHISGTSLAPVARLPARSRKNAGNCAGRT